VARFQGLPNYEKLADDVIHDVITTIQEARNEPATLTALSAPPES
jgi:hypothetical protein